jgi:hypothetical protein
MKGRLIRKGSIALAMVVALMGAGAVAAYATIPNAGVIHACFLTSTGVLRVIDATVTNCAKKETALKWNVQGVQGVQGPQGVQGTQGIQGNQGPQGDPGLPGVSHGYFGSSTDAPVAQGPAWSSVGSISSLPAGAYMIWAEVQLSDGLNEPLDACRIAVNGIPVSSRNEVINLKSGLGDLTLVSAATLSGGGSSVEADCTSSDNSGTADLNLSLVAVDALN